MKALKRILFYIVQFTWGLPITITGAIAALALLSSGFKPKLFNGYIYFVVGKNWGGVNFGCFIVLSETSAKSKYTVLHEAGHGIQNLIYGFLMPFVVSIPSSIRYWYRRFMTYIGKGDALPDYYSIWFEKQASELGEKYYGDSAVLSL